MHGTHAFVPLKAELWPCPPRGPPLPAPTRTELQAGPPRVGRRVVHAVRHLAGWVRVGAISPKGHWSRPCTSTVGRGMGGSVPAGAVRSHRARAGNEHVSVSAGEDAECAVEGVLRWAAKACVGIDRGITRTCATPGHSAPSALPPTTSTIYSCYQHFGFTRFSCTLFALPFY